MNGQLKGHVTHDH